MKKLSKVLSVTLAVTCTICLSGVAMLTPVAGATILEGDIVSPDAEYVDADGNTYYPYDVFIMKYVGDKKFKRLVLNPQVFESYGHLEWGNIKTVTVSELEAFSSADAVRADGDDKVYKLFPDGDIGTKRWVESLDCFNTKGYDWDSVYIINSVDRDNYTTGATMCGGLVEEGDITLSLASDNPAAATLPPNAQGVTFLSVNIAGSGTVNQITVKRLGAGGTGDFGDLYIYKDGVRLTSGRSLSSATSKVTFINLGLQAPATFQLVADMSASSAGGNVNYFGIESASDVTSGATVGGNFPLNGNPMGISSTNAGTLKVERSGSTSRNVTIGDREVEISQFKVTTATEGANIHRIQLFNAGDVTHTRITNVKLKDNTESTVATATEIGEDGYVTFVFDEPYYIKKGDSEIFRVYADIGGVRPDRNIKLYLELATDILGIGTTYGYGMKTGISTTDTPAGSYDSTYYITVACKGGDLTLNDLGPNATKIGTDTDDTVFLEFSMTAAADITVKRTRLIMCLDSTGNGTYEDDWVTTSTSAGADITDIKIADKDSGTIIIGPKDGTAFNEGEQDNACPNNKDGIYEEFTDTFDISTGEQKTLQVTADIDTSATLSATEISTGDIIRFYLYSYASLGGNVNNLKYTGTTDAVAAASISPSSNIAGEEMTIAAAGLTLSLAAAPSGSSGGSDYKTYIAGQEEVEAVGIIFEAGTASDITVNSITLTAYISGEGGDASQWLSGQDIDYVKDHIGNVYIYEKENGNMIPGSSAKGFSGSSVYELVEYTGLSWTISAGETKTLLVKSDISGASPASTSTPTAYIAFDIEGTSDVSAVDKDGNSVTPSGVPANGGNDSNVLVDPSTDFGIADYGSLAIDQATDTPDKSLVVMGTSDNEISKFKISGTNEAWYIEKFSVVLSDGEETGEPDPEDRDNFSAVKIKYQTEAQSGTDNWTLSSGKTFGANASLAFAFSGDSRIYVPKDDDSYLTVLVDILSYSGGTGAKSKKAFKIYDLDGSSDSFLAYGAQSGKQLIDYTTDSAAAADFNLHFVTRSKPVFAKSAWSGAEAEVARFTITAEGYNVIFDGIDGHDSGDEEDFASAGLAFEMIATTSAGSTGDLFLYDWNENIVASIDDITWANTSVSLTFEVDDVTVPAGTTKEFHIDLAAGDATDFVYTTDHIYLKMKNDLSTYGDIATGSMGFGQRSVVWDDGTHEEGISSGDGDANVESRYGMPEDVLGIGLPMIFRVLRGTNTNLP
jgi:hypothetical protein